MRELTAIEAKRLLDGSEGDVKAIEASIGELALKEVGTDCGYSDNKAFISLGVLFPDNATRFVRGLYNEKDNVMTGMVHIQCADEDMAEDISRVAHDVGGGSLRPDGKSFWKGFYVFEIE
jgi:hypothetical protein